MKLKVEWNQIIFLSPTPSKNKETISKYVYVPNAKSILLSMIKIYKRWDDDYFSGTFKEFKVKKL